MNKDLILERAVTVFTDINSRINLLIDCSARDFDILHQGFIDYHKTIGEFTIFTNQLFDELLSIPEDKLNAYLERINRLNDNYRELYDLLGNAHQNISLLVKDIGYAKLYINNQKQNISTLKLLVTNIQLEPSSREFYTDLIEQINHLQSFNKKLTREFNSAEKRIQSCAESIDGIASHQLPTVRQNLEKYTKVVSRLKETKAHCRIYDEILKKLISKKSDSTSEIITNLQFQDIIRQKIEHVQEAQSFLLDKLQSHKPDSSNSDDSSKEVLKFILQIRDIGTLQAAQMVHANIEYQKAVDIITEKFEELDTILTELTILMNKFPSAGQPDSKHSFPELIKTKSYLELESDTLNDQISCCKQMNADMARKDEILLSLINETNKYIADCQQILDKIKPEKAIITSKSNQVNINLQLKNNFEAFLSNTDELNKLLRQNHKRIEGETLPELNTIFKNHDRISSELRTCLQEIEVLLPEQKVKNQSGKLSGMQKDLLTKKFSSNEIQYYSVFDKEIEEIISNLNHLIGLIDFKAVEQELDFDNLEEIKHLYTMESERHVHSSVTGDKKKNKDKNDNEIEIF